MGINRNDGLKKFTRNFFEIKEKLEMKKPFKRFKKTFEKKFDDYIKSMGIHRKEGEKKNLRILKMEGKKLGCQKTFKSILHEWGHMRNNQKTFKKLMFKKTKKKQTKKWKKKEIENQNYYFYTP